MKPLKGLNRLKVLIELKEATGPLKLFNHLTDSKVMSQHRSLRAAATLGGKRNVLKRFERLELLKKRGQWKEGDRITGLRKTKREA